MRIAARTTAGALVVALAALGFWLALREDGTGGAAGRGDAASGQADAASLVVHGRALRLDGEPVAGVAVCVRGDPPGTVRARSDARGGFAIELAPGSVLDTSESGWTVLWWHQVTAQHARDSHPLVLGPTVALAGVLVEVTGRALEGDVLVVLPATLFRAVPELQPSMRRLFQYATDAAGRFAIEDAPAVDGAQLIGAAPGFHVAGERSPVPLASRRDLRLELTRPGLEHPDGPHACGIVCDAEGRALWDAEVRYAGRRALTDVMGEFVLPLPADSRSRDAQRLAAGKPGHRPYVEEDFGGRVREARAKLERSAPEEWPEARHLRLELALDEPLAIAGRVVDSAGRPVEGALVRRVDGVELQPGRASPRFAEDLAGSRDVGTDEQGRFELGGLLAREYTLGVVDHESHAVQAFAHIAAGERDARLELALAERYPSVRGIARDRSGRPLRKVRVRARIPIGPPESEWYRSDWIDVGQTWTDHEGAFELEDLPRGRLFLWVADGGPTEIALEALDPEEALESELGELGSVVLRVGQGCGIEIARHGAASRSSGATELRSAPTYAPRGPYDCNQAGTRR